jgi:hypothetical protein
VLVLGEEDSERERWSRLRACGGGVRHPSHWSRPAAGTVLTRISGPEISPRDALREKMYTAICIKPRRRPVRFGSIHGIARCSSRPYTTQLVQDTVWSTARMANTVPQVIPHAARCFHDTD